jgi:hypothetical protein
MLQQVCHDAEESRDTSSPEPSCRVESLASPDPPLRLSRFSSPSAGQNAVVDSSLPTVVQSSPLREIAAAVVNSPTPVTSPRQSTPQERETSAAEHAASTTEASSSNDWWRDVATRWPTIIAKLRTGSGVPAIVPASPGERGRKRPQSGHEDFQSPKRSCAGSICQSVPTPTRQTISEFTPLD